MALPSTSVWEVRPTNGANTNGGGFDSTGTGTDFSTQNAKNSGSNNKSTTDAVAAGTTTITSVTAAFTTAITGNIIYLQGGSGSLAAGWYRATYVSATSITVDRSVATGTAITMNIGGALATIPQFNTNAVAGNVCWVKAEATISTGSVINITISNASNYPGALIGYTTTRGDNGQVTIAASTNLAGNPLVQIETDGFVIANFIISANGNTARGLDLNAAVAQAINCTITGMTDAYSLNMQANNTTCVNCIVTGATGSTTVDAFRFTGSFCSAINCVAYSNSGTGFNWNGGNGATLHGCIAAACNIGFILAPSQSYLFVTNCLAYKNTGDGFRIAFGQFTAFVIINNVSYGNGAYGFSNSTNTGASTNYSLPTGVPGPNYNAYGANTTANLNFLTAGANDVTLSADPTVAGGSNNFALNATSGGGASCRAAGFPGTFGIGGTGYLDLGPLQSASAGSTTYVINRNQTILVGEI